MMIYVVKSANNSRVVFICLEMSHITLTIPLVNSPNS